MRKEEREHLDLFCSEYLKDFNATAAYRRMIPEKAKEMSPEYVKKEAHEWLTAAKESGILDQKKAELCYKADIEAEWVINQAVQGLRMSSEGTPVLNFKGEQVYTKTPEGELMAVYRFDGKAHAAYLKMLGQYVGVFTDKVIVDTKTGLADLLKERVEKASGKG